MNDHARTNSPQRMVIDEDSKDFIAVSDRRDALEKPGCQILEFVFGRSIATNLLEEIRIVFKNGSWNTQSSPINPVGILVSI
jgi:hypothetical protein